MRIGFVMPAFNEEELLGVTLDGCVALVDRLVIVDDGSTDATGRIADERARAQPDKIEVIHQANTGIGGAVIAGLRRLLERDDLDALGIIASDDQCDPALIPRFRRMLETRPDIDVAKGSRFLHPETLHAMPRFRYWGNRGVSLVMQLVLGYRGMSDVLHGYLLGAHARLPRHGLFAHRRRLRSREHDDGGVPPPALPLRHPAEPVALWPRALEDRLSHADPEDAAQDGPHSAHAAWLGPAARAADAAAAGERQPAGGLSVAAADQPARRAPQAG